MSSSGSLILSDAGRWQNRSVFFMGQQCVRRAQRKHNLIFRLMSVFILTCVFLLFPKVFLLRPVRQATGHSDGSRRRRQWDVLVWGSAVHGVLGFHCQGKSVVLRHGTRTTYVTGYVFMVVFFWFHRCGSVLQPAPPLTREPSLNYWQSWSTILGWGKRFLWLIVQKRKKNKTHSYLDFLFITHIQVNTISLNPAGTLLVSGCKDGTATIWDTSSYTTLQQVHCHDGTIHHMAFSPGMSLWVKV